MTSLPGREGAADVMTLRNTPLWCERSMGLARGKR